MNIHGNFKYTLDLDKQDEYGCFTATIKTERKSYTGQSRKPAIAIAYALEEAAKDLHEAQRILDDLDRVSGNLIDAFNKHTNFIHNPDAPTSAKGLRHAHSQGELVGGRVHRRNLVVDGWHDWCRHLLQ